MLISIIIPHYNQPEHLIACLKSLQSQKDFTSELEIIVVDNGSTQSPTEVLSNFPDATLLIQKTPGPGPARNLGTTSAQGNILAFIDADCHAHEGWISAIEKSFQNPGTQIIGGDVQVEYANPAKPTFLEPYERLYAYRNKRYIAQGFSGTGNLAMRSDVFKTVGPFAGLGTAEDRDWGLRATAQGFKIAYVENMIVYHPARKSFDELAGKWDRHIAHDYSDLADKPLGKVRWVVKACLLAASPLGELATLAFSKRIKGLKERRLAFLCLTKIRFHRARRMLQVLFNRPSEQTEGDWSR